MLDEVINMLAAVRDAAAADTFSALLSNNSDDITAVQTPQHPSSTTRHIDQQQQHRRVPARPASVASIDLRDPDEM